jgi:gamma-glutamyl AIG2-like cyclotransferase
MKLFGYGSLLSADAIADHKLGPENFTESKLQEATLKGYERDWNAKSGPWKYLGLEKKAGQSVNGVLFSLDDKEIPRFKQVEGVPEVYDMVDVSQNLTPFQDAPVFTLVTRQPTTKGVIPADYVQQVKAALKHRSKGFQAKFRAETRLP